MQYLTPAEVQRILKVSRSWVSRHREALGGIKIGKVVRFNKETFFEKLKELENGSIVSSWELEIRNLEQGQKNPGARRIQDQAGGSNSPKRSQGSLNDKYGLYRLVRGKA
jgi:hypothetical protein